MVEMCPGSAARAQVYCDLARERSNILTDRLARIFLARVIQTDTMARCNERRGQIPSQLDVGTDDEMLPDENVLVVSGGIRHWPAAPTLTSGLMTVIFLLFALPLTSSDEASDSSAARQ